MAWSKDDKEWLVGTEGMVNGHVRNHENRCQQHRENQSAHVATIRALNTGWAKKNGPFLNVDNFATVSGRKACDMSKVCKLCLE